MTTPNIEELIAKLRTSMGDLDCPNTYEFAMHQAADALQSQAERIVELEKLLQNGSEIIAGLFARAANMEAERDTLRVQLADAELHTKQVERGLGKATAQLAAIAATEPVGYAVPTFNFDNSVIQSVQYAGTVPLFTRPMPAQDVTELVEALEKLARLGNGEHYGNSDGNMIARDSLSKYKGAK